MPIYQTAHYQVNAAAAAKVAAAASSFVDYVAANEPGTTMYAAWQQVDDPSRFVHLFIFADEAAHQAHGASDAVRQFEAVYRPELVGGPVVFTDYHLVAAKMPAGLD
jgi:quinol monooxygenase YgiN